MSTSCEKEDPVDLKPEKMLAEQYPEWSNLTLISTNGVNILDFPNARPTLTININENVVTIKQVTKNGTFITGVFSQMTINAPNVRFYECINCSGILVNVTGTFVSDDSKITLETKGLTTSSAIYVYQIN